MKPFKFVDWLNDFVNSNERLAISQLIDLLSKDYGIEVDKAYILAQVKGTKIYYDDYMECLYKDKESYYKDI